MTGYFGQDYDDDGRLIPEPGPQVVSLSDVKPERISWLWDGRLPLGKLVILDGDPGVGKSMLTVDWSARVSTGSPWPDGAACQLGDVLIMSAEDGLADTIRPRLDAAGGDAHRVHALTEIVTIGEDGQAYTRPPSIPGDLGLVERIVTEHRVKLLIIDVLMAYLSGDVNAHRDQDVRRALHRLSAMADRARCCVIVLRHLNKTISTNVLYRGGGSIGIVGQARAAFIAAPDPDDGDGQRRVFAATKMNIAAMPDALAYRLVPDELHGCARIQWDGATDHTAAGLLAGMPQPDDGQERDAEGRTERDEAAEWLTDYLTDHGGEATPGDAKQAAREAGIAVRTLERARFRSGAKVVRSGFPAVTVWRLATVSPQSRQHRQSPDADETGETGGETDA